MLVVKCRALGSFFKFYIKNTTCFLPRGDKQHAAAVADYVEPKTMINAPLKAARACCVVSDDQIFRGEEAVAHRFQTHV